MLLGLGEDGGKDEETRLMYCHSAPTKSIECVRHQIKPFVSQPPLPLYLEEEVGEGPWPIIDSRLT